MCETVKLVHVYRRNADEMLLLLRWNEGLICEDPLRSLCRHLFTMTPLAQRSVDNAATVRGSRRAADLTTAAVISHALWLAQSASDTHVVVLSVLYTRCVSVAGKQLSLQHRASILHRGWSPVIHCYSWVTWVGNRTSQTGALSSSLCIS